MAAPTQANACGFFCLFFGEGAAARGAAAAVGRGALVEEAGVLGRSSAGRGGSRSAARGAAGEEVGEAAASRRNPSGPNFNFAPDIQIGPNNFYNSSPDQESEPYQEAAPYVDAIPDQSESSYVEAAPYIGSAPYQEASPYVEATPYGWQNDGQENVETLVLPNDNTEQLPEGGGDDGMVATATEIEPGQAVEVSVEAVPEYSEE